MLSYKILVNFESLYGIYSFLLAEVKALITFPKQDNDLLIIFASSNYCPVTLVLLTFSDPARSTKNNLPSFLL